MEDQMVHQSLVYSHLEDVWLPFDDVEDANTGVHHKPQNKNGGIQEADSPAAKAL